MRQRAMLYTLCVLFLFCSCTALQPREEQVLILDRYWAYTVAYKYEVSEYGYCYGWHDGEYTYDWGLCKEVKTRCEHRAVDRVLPSYRPQMCDAGVNDWEEQSLEYYILGRRLGDGTEITATIGEGDWEHFEVGTERQVLVSVMGHVVAWTDDFERDQE